MTKSASGNSSNLLGLLVLIAIGVLVVFAIPSLTGHATRLSFAGSMPLSAAVTYLYPVGRPTSVSFVGNVSNAVSDNSTSYASLGGHIDGIGSSDCPQESGFTRIPSTGDFRDTIGGPPINYCSFDRGDSPYVSQRNRLVNFTAWFMTAAAKFRPLGGRTILNPTNITHVQLNLSELNLGCWATTDTYTCNASASVVVFAKAKCAGASGGYTWRYVGSCRISDNREGFVCTRALGVTADCPAGTWRVNRLVVAHKYDVDENPDPAVHWVRLLQNAA